MAAYQAETAGNDWNIAELENGGLRFEVRDNDHPLLGGAIERVREQASVVFSDAFVDDVPLSIAFDLTIDPGEPNDAPYLVLARLVANMPGGSSQQSVFDICLVGDLMVAYARHVADDGAVVVEKIFSDVVDIERGHGYRIEVKAVVDPDGAGRLVLVRDGVVVADYAGALGYAGQESVSWSEGIVRGAAATHTLSASFSALDIVVGDGVEFPEATIFLPEPSLVLENVVFAPSDTGGFVATATGATLPGLTVSLFVDQVLYATTVAGDDGSYSFEVDIAERGLHRLSAVAGDDAGLTSIASYPVDFAIGDANDRAASASPLFFLTVGTETFLVQNAGETWSIAALDEDSLRFELRDNERHDWDRAHWHRSERTEIATSKSPINDGVPLSISYGLLIEPGGRNTADWMVLGQLHQDQSSGGPAVSPPVAIVMVGERMSIVINFGSSSAPESRTIFLDSTDILRGHLYDMTISALIGAEGGRLVIERDGVILVEYAGPLGYAEQQGVYWAQGIYRSDNATETVAVQYHDLVIERGEDVDFPPEGSFIAAPVVAVEFAELLADEPDSLGPALDVVLSGWSAPGAVVTISEKGVFLAMAATDSQGRFSTTVTLSGTGSHDLVAVATNSEGRSGIASSPSTVLVATSADVVGMLGVFPAVHSIASIVLTDENVLHVTSAQELSYALRRDASVLAKIEGGYTILLSQVVAGQGYDRQDTSYSAMGQVMEITRWSGSRIVYEDEFHLDGSHVLTAWAASGAFERVTFSPTGARLLVESFNAAGSLSSSRENFPDGASVTRYYNTVTHIEIHNVLVAADKSKIDTYVNLQGRDYATQVFSYDATGRLVAQQRYTEAGIQLLATFWKADGSTSVSSFNATTGHEVLRQVTASDGTRTVIRFGDAAGTFVLQEDRLTAAGDLLSRKTFAADGTSTLLTVSTREGARSSVLEAFDASGHLATRVGYVGAVVVSADTYRADGSYETHSYDPLTGSELASVIWQADGSRVSSLFHLVGRSYDRQSQSYDAANQLVESSRWLGDRLIHHEIRAADGARTVEIWTDAFHTVTRFASSGALTSVERFDADGTLVGSEVRRGDGSREVHVYDGVTGKEQTSMVWNADGSRVSTVFQLVGRSYDTQSHTYDAAGHLVESARWSGGTLVYHSILYADGTSTVENWTGGCLTVSRFAASGALASNERFDADGTMVSREMRHEDGSRESHLYDGSTGVVTSSTIVESDGSRTVSQFAIAGQTYDTQLKSFDASGRLTDMVRMLGGEDGTVVHEAHYRHDGSSATSLFDAFGRATIRTIVDADASKTIISFRYDGDRLDPVGVREDHWGSSGTKLWSDVQASDGSHTITALAEDLVLHDHAGTSDLFKSAGSETFVFGPSPGHDRIANFHDSGSHQDLIHIDASVATAFEDLHIVAVGADAMIVLSPENSITLTNVALDNLSADDFLWG